MPNYTTGIPTTNQSLGQTQQVIQDNFTLLNTTVSVNHVAMNSSGAGKHRFIQMPRQAAIPAGLVANDGTIYTKVANSASQIFYSPDNSGNEYQLTRTISASFATFSTDPGWCFLPGGMLMQWGTNTSASGATISFPTAFTSAPYSIQCTIFQNTTNRHFVYARSSTNANFVTTQLESGGSAETSTFSWIAIVK